MSVSNLSDEAVSHKEQRLSPDFPRLAGSLQSHRAGLDSYIQAWSTAPTDDHTRDTHRRATDTPEYKPFTTFGLRP